MPHTHIFPKLFFIITTATAQLKKFTGEITPRSCSFFYIFTVSLARKKDMSFWSKNQTCVFFTFNENFVLLHLLSSLKNNFFIILFHIILITLNLFIKKLFDSSKYLCDTINGLSSMCVSMCIQVYTCVRLWVDQLVCKCLCVCVLIGRRLDIFTWCLGVWLSASVFMPNLLGGQGSRNGNVSFCVYAKGQPDDSQKNNVSLLLDAEGIWPEDGWDHRYRDRLR